MSTHGLGGEPEVLTSWKEIARYLGKGVRTVQRWELTLGLPVKRPCGADARIVMARREDLDQWLSNGWRINGKASPSLTPKPHLELLRTVNENLSTFVQRSTRIRQSMEGFIAARQGLLRELHKLKSQMGHWNKPVHGASAQAIPPQREEVPPEAAQLSVSARSQRSNGSPVQ